MKRWILFTVVLLVHLALSVAALLWTYGISSDHFDGHVTSALASYAANGLLAVAWFPLNLLPLPANRFPGFLGWLPVITNSLIWAGFITWASQRVRLSSRCRSQSGFHTH